MVVNEQAENDVATITDMKQPSGGKLTVQYFEDSYSH
jgi:hypothetical protein